MRPVLPPDLDLLARAMLPLAEGVRRAAMAELIARADIADRFRKRTGRLHPDHGDGSLQSLALRQRAAPVRSNCDADYLAALSSVIEAIALWRDRTGNHRQL